MTHGPDAQHLGVLIPLSNERLHCGGGTVVPPWEHAHLIPLSNERLHCGPCATHPLIVNIQALGFGVAVGDRWSRFDGGCVLLAG